MDVIAVKVLIEVLVLDELIEVLELVELVVGEPVANTLHPALQELGTEEEREEAQTAAGREQASFNGILLFAGNAPDTEVPKKVRIQRYHLVAIYPAWTRFPNW